MRARTIRGEASKAGVFDDSVSERLRYVGAEVVTRNAAGKLLRTDLTGVSAVSDKLDVIAASPSINVGEEARLRAELEDKKRELQALQRNYQSVSALSAKQAQEMEGYKSQRDLAEKELKSLQEEHCRLARELQSKVEAELVWKQAKEDLQAKLGQKSSASDKRLGELQEALKLAQKQIQQLQERERSERDRAAAAESKLGESNKQRQLHKEDLERAKRQLDEKQDLLEKASRGAQLAQNEISKMRSELEQVTSNLEQLQSQAAEGNSLRQKLRQLEASSSKEAAELSTLRGQLQEAQSTLASQRNMLTSQETELQELRQAQLQSAREIAEALKRAAAAEDGAAMDVQALRKALDLERQEVAEVRKELKSNLSQHQGTLDQVSQEAQEKLRAAEMQAREKEDRLQLELRRLQREMQDSKCAANEALKARERDLRLEVEKRVSAQAASESAAGSLKGHLEALASEREALSKEIERLVGQEKRSSLELESLRSQLEVAERELREASESRRDLEASLASSEAQRHALEHDLSTSRGELEARTSDLETVHSELAREKNRVAVLEEGQRTAAEELAAATARLAEDLNTAKQALTQERRAHEDAKERLSSVEADSAAQSKELSELQERLRKVLEEQTKAEARLAKEMGALEDALGEAQRSNAQLHQEDLKKKKDLEARLLRAEGEAKGFSALQKEITALKEATALASADSEKWARKAAEVEAKHGTAIASLRRAEANLELATSHSQELEVEISNLRAEVEAKDLRLANLSR